MFLHRLLGYHLHVTIREKDHFIFYLTRRIDFLILFYIFDKKIMIIIIIIIIIRTIIITKIITIIITMKIIIILCRLFSLFLSLLLLLLSLYFSPCFSLSLSLALSLALKLSLITATYTPQHWISKNFTLTVYSFEEDSEMIVSHETGFICDNHYYDWL